MRETEFTTFGQWLRFYRTRREYTMRQMGRLLGVSGQTVKNWEMNPAGPSALAQRPDRDVIRKFAELTGADAAEGERLGGYAADDPEAVLREMAGAEASLDAEVSAALAEAKRYPEPYRSLAMRLAIDAIHAGLKQGRLMGGLPREERGGDGPER